MTAPSRILIVNPFGIGDVLFTTPLVRAVRNAFPNSVIGYLCNRRTEPILTTNPHVNEVFVYEKDELQREWRRSRRHGLRYLTSLLVRIRQARFDWVLDLSLGERYGIAVFGNVVLSGLLAWSLRRLVYILFMPGMARKLRLIFDWTLHLFGFNYIIDIERNK